MIIRTNIVIHFLLLTPLLAIPVLKFTILDLVSTEAWLLLFSAWYTLVILIHLYLIRRQNTKYSRRTEIEEYTRQRIILQLQDEVMNFVIVAMRTLEIIDLRDRENTELKINESIGYLRKAYQQSGVLTRSLSSENVKDGSLVLGLYCAVHREDPVFPFDVSFNVIGVERWLDFEREILIFRIALEWLRTVEKYAEAMMVKTTIAYNSGTIELYITDDGKWIEPIYNYESMLRTINLMAEATNGTVEILKRPDQTTTMQLTVYTRLLVI